MKKHILVAGMLLLAMIGLMLKVASPALVKVADLDKYEKQMAAQLSREGLYLSGVRALTHQGVYRAMSFHHRVCDGVLIVMLLDRNGEAARILDSLPGESGFYYQGTRYEDFPYWAYLFGKLTNGARVVVAYREAGDCRLHSILSK